MLYANDKHGNKIKAQPGVKAICPCCESEVVSKCGQVKIWHWAHTSKRECDPWYVGESDWHLGWKSLFPPENVEVVIERNGKKHRADVLLNNGEVIEFQHSSISITELQERNDFYGTVHWVFDARKAFESCRLVISDNGNFDWSYRPAYILDGSIIDTGTMGLYSIGKSFSKKIPQEQIVAWNHNSYLRPNNVVFGNLAALYNRKTPTFDSYGRYMNLCLKPELLSSHIKKLEAMPDCDHHIQAQQIVCGYHGQTPNELERYWIKGVAAYLYEMELQRLAELERQRIAAEEKVERERLQEQRRLEMLDRFDGSPIYKWVKYGFEPYESSYNKKTFYGTCPKGVEMRGESFNVWPQLGDFGGYKCDNDCYGCAEKGNFIKFLMHFHHKLYPDALCIATELKQQQRTAPEQTNKDWYTDSLYELDECVGL